MKKNYLIEQSVSCSQYDPILKNAVKVLKNKSIGYILVFNGKIMPGNKRATFLRPKTAEFPQELGLLFHLYRK